jgi:hypothetical protein
MRKNTIKTPLDIRQRFFSAPVIFAISVALSYSLLTQPAISQNSSSPDAADGDATTGNGGYPRVTALEQQFLGKTYVNDPLATRVSRLETNKFGKPQTGEIVDRLDKLDQFAAPTKVPPGYQSAEDDESVQQPMAGAAGSNSGDSTLEAAKESGDIGNYPRITELEQEFLGKVYKGEVVQDRLARLEDKEFSKEYPEDALCDRVDRLDKKAKPKPKVADDDDGSGQSGGKGSAMSGIGKTLVNMLGGGMLGGGGMGMMGGPMGGMGGMGMPGMGMGMSGGRRRNMQNQQQDNTPVVKAPAASVNPFGPAGEDVKGAENRTATMEKFCFGKENGAKPLEERVAKLEKRLVPWEHSAASKDMNTRVNHLWSMLQAANSNSHKDKEVPQ